MRIPKNRKKRLKKLYVDILRPQYENQLKLSKLKFRLYCAWASILSLRQYDSVYNEISNEVLSDKDFIKELFPTEYKRES